MSTHQFDTTPCKGCGKPIVWAKHTLTGKMIPLDAKAHVYAVSSENGHAICTANMYSMVSHFATCAFANDFSKTKKAMR